MAIAMCYDYFGRSHNFGRYGCEGASYVPVGCVVFGSVLLMVCMGGRFVNHKMIESE